MRVATARRLPSRDAPGGGTIVRWSSQWDSADPITAFLLRTAANDTVKRLAKAAVI